MDPVTAAIAAAGFALVGGIAWIAESIKANQRKKYKAAYDEAYTAYQNAQNTVNQLEAQVTETELAIDQTEANISAFDQTLVRWQSQYDQQLQSLQLEGEASYNELMSNWQGAELVNATRGQTGGSAELVAQSQMAQVERLAGSDLRLDDNGGMFGTAMNEFRLDMLAGRTELVGNLNISREALTKYQGMLTSYQSSLASARTKLTQSQANLTKAEEDARKHGVDEEYLGG